MPTPRVRVAISVSRGVGGCSGGGRFDRQAPGEPSFLRRWTVVESWARSGSQEIDEPADGVLGICVGGNKLRAMKPESDAFDVAAIAGDRAFEIEVKQAMVW